MFLVFLGAPGAGKGTQAAVVSQKLGLPHIASGDLFRQAVEKGSKLGQLVKSYMDSGSLVPDSVTIEVISERLNEPDCQSGCVFDGFPRTVEQAKALDEVLTKRKAAIDKAVFIDVPGDALLKRLAGRWLCRKCQAPYHEVHSPPKVAKICDKCGGELYQRDDDTEETIKKRLEVYFAQTAPVLDYYSETGALVKVDGTVEIGKVTEQITKALNI